MSIDKDTLQRITALMDSQNHDDQKLAYYLLKGQRILMTDFLHQFYKDISIEFKIMKYSRRLSRQVCEIYQKTPKVIYEDTLEEGVEKEQHRKVMVRFYRMSYTANDDTIKPNLKAQFYEYVASEKVNDVYAARGWVFREERVFFDTWNAIIYLQRWFKRTDGETTPLGW